VINHLIEFFSLQHRLLNLWQLPLTGLLLSIGCTTQASTLEVAPSQPAPGADANAIAISQIPASTESIPDGTYLYGQSSQPAQIGKEYIVFEARQGKVIGAMYLPSSEYSCFYGTLDSKQLNLTVANPYDQTAFSHTIARAQVTQVAAAGGSLPIQNGYDSLTYPHTVGLEGYQPISKIGDNDKQILSTCRSTYQAQVWNQQ
jgi:hypothetical protein